MRRKKKGRPNSTHEMDTTEKMIRLCGIYRQMDTLGNIVLMLEQTLHDNLFFCLNFCNLDIYYIKQLLVTTKRDINTPKTTT